MYHDFEVMKMILTMTSQISTAILNAVTQTSFLLQLIHNHAQSSEVIVLAPQIFVLYRKDNVLKIFCHNYLISICCKVINTPLINTI